MIYSEIWEVLGNSNGDRIQIVYTDEELKNGVVDLKRKAVSEMHNCRLGHLLRVNKYEGDGMIIGKESTAQMNSFIIGQRQKAHWVYCEDGFIRCSACDLTPINRIAVKGSVVYEIPEITKVMKYCPRCGAEMECKS